jgi:zinc D-Ala-D-Ala dipeptidase
MLIILTAGTVLALPEGFSYLSDLTPSVQQEMRYFSAHNFVGRRIEGYDRPVCILTTEAAARLARVEMEARSLGFTLKVYDCYRPQTAVDDFVRWASNYSDLKMKD